MTSTEMLTKANRYDAIAESFRLERAVESWKFYRDVALNWRIAATCVRQIEDAKLLEAA